jgi:hypothetical protein
MPSPSASLHPSVVVVVVLVDVLVVGSAVVLVVDDVVVLDVLLVDDVLVVGSVVLVDDDVLDVVLVDDVLVVGSVVLVVDDVVVDVLLDDEVLVLEDVDVDVEVDVVGVRHVPVALHTPPVHAVPTLFKVHVAVQHDAAVPFAAPSSHGSIQLRRPSPQRATPRTRALPWSAMNRVPPPSTATP